MSRTVNRFGCLFVASVLASASAPLAYGQCCGGDIRVVHDWTVGTESFRVGLTEYEGAFDYTTISCGDRYVSSEWSAPAIVFAASAPVAAFLALGMLTLAISTARRPPARNA